MCINDTFFYLWQVKLLNGKNKFIYKYCKSKIITVTLHLLEVEVKTLQIFKLPIWLKIHYSFVTIMSKRPWSYSISCTAPCPRLHTAFSAIFSFSLIGNRDFRSISLAHAHGTAAMSWGEGTVQERWKYKYTFYRDGSPVCQLLDF